MTAPKTARPPDTQNISSPPLVRDPLSRRISGLTMQERIGRQHEGRRIGPTKDGSLDGRQQQAQEPPEQGRQPTPGTSNLVPVVG